VPRRGPRALAAIAGAEAVLGAGALLARNALAVPSGVFNDLGVSSTRTGARPG
jgi:hypothetical protein